MLLRKDVSQTIRYFQEFLEYCKRYDSIARKDIYQRLAINMYHNSVISSDLNPLQIRIIETNIKDERYLAAIGLIYSCRVEKRYPWFGIPQLIGSLISSTFIWSDTLEGSKFWSKLDTEFKRYARIRHDSKSLFIINESLDDSIIPEDTPLKETMLWS